MHEMKKRLPWILLVSLSTIILGQCFFILKEHGKEMIIHLHADSVKRHCQFAFSMQYSFLGRVGAFADGGGAPIACDERVELAPRVWVDCYCPTSGDPK